MRSPRSRLAPRRQEAIEWIGGKVTLPIVLDDRPAPYRPVGVFWLEDPSDLVVGFRLVEAHESQGVLGAELRKALGRPVAGRRRRPNQIRVADRALADEVRGAVGDSIPVLVAPTPEIDEFAIALMHHLANASEAGPDDAFLGPSEPEAAPAGTAAGRNDPCPCGSGRKYKKCCLHNNAAGQSSASAAATLHQQDERLVAHLTRYAIDRFGEAASDFMADFYDVNAALQLAFPWSVYGFQVEGRPVVDWYLDELGDQRPAAERDWLEAQRAAWLSLWEVIAVDPGRSLTLRDLLSGQTRFVYEESGSRTLTPRLVILGRVVDHAGISVLCGVHPRPLTPTAAAEVLRRARSRLRLRREVPIERLRDGAFGRFLIRRWEEAFRRLAARQPELRNTDGERLLLSTERYAIEPGAAGAVAAALAALPGVEPPDPDDPEGPYTFLRPGNAMHRDWQNTIIGHAWIEHDTLALQTNSLERADRLQRTVEAACGQHLRHLERETLHPEDLPRGAAPAPVSPEKQQLLFDVKRRHYAAWPDQPLPALQGQTPREAVKTKDGREAVDILIKEMEYFERRRSEEPQFDFAALRRALGL